MKKSILIIALILTGIIGYSQSIQVHILNVQPTIVCKSDSILISWKPQASGQTQAFFVYDFGGINFSDEVIIHNGYASTATTYTVWCKLPPDVVLGNVGVCSATCKYFNVEACITTGIEEYELNNTAPIYLDMQGRVIPKRYNELIIEQRGNTRHKVYITE